MPWKWIGHQVRVLVAGQQASIYHGEQALAVHPQRVGRRQRSLQRSHLEGLVGAWSERPAAAPPPAAGAAPPLPELLRPLSDYASAVGGGWQ